MLLLHIFLAFSHISVCVFVVFFPCLFHPKTCLIFLSTIITIYKDTKLYGNMRATAAAAVASVREFSYLCREFSGTYIGDTYRKIP